MAAVEDAERGIYGIQFHPEVVHTSYGQEILTRFLTEVCGCELTWSAAGIVEEQIERIRRQVGDGKVICGLSGGVDSSVAALLVHRAVGNRLTCVFVDHGLMRKDEGEQVVSAFRDTFKVPLVAVDAERRFLEKLKGVSEPEAKRKAIGAEFIRVFEEEAAKLAEGDGDEGAHPSDGPVRGPIQRREILVQGTLYSDVIESGGGTGRRRSSPITTWAGCRTISNSSWWSRCGRCSRTRCARWARSWACRSVWFGASPPGGRDWRSGSWGRGATKERLDVLREADSILQEEIRKAGLYRELWQSFCVLPDVRTDGRAGGRAHIWLRGGREGGDER